MCDPAKPLIANVLDRYPNRGCFYRQYQPVQARQVQQGEFEHLHQKCRRLQIERNLFKVTQSDIQRQLSIFQDQNKYEELYLNYQHLEKQYNDTRGLQAYLRQLELTVKELENRLMSYNNNQSNIIKDQQQKVKTPPQTSPNYQVLISGLNRQLSTLKMSLYQRNIELEQAYSRLQQYSHQGTVIKGIPNAISKLQEDLNEVIHSNFELLKNQCTKEIRKSPAPKEIRQNARSMTSMASTRAVPYQTPQSHRVNLSSRKPVTAGFAFI